MEAAKTKLRSHREKALKNGTSASEYVELIGMSPQRLSRLMKPENGVEPTVSEAFLLQDRAKIPPKMWLRD